MKIEINRIKILVNENEALSLINTLQKGLGDGQFSQNKETEGARNLLALLRGNFQSSKRGVHMI